ncbi:MAG: ketoacyl-ACP synthase III [Actinobacteria bacterium]|nr:ketoacyl-ACP synthase III [Actinomycetota bacterium]MDA3017031.1 ketoacyl-ACP synthase III [Actinomycetota bacterium]
MPIVPTSAIGAKFIGWGTSLPEKIITNDDLSKTLDTSDEWIRERTGIERRHVGGTTASLSIESGRKAIQMAGIDPLTIDALVLSTTTPDRTVPATSATVQHGLGLRCGAFDVNAACSGFVYALVVGHGLVAMGMRRILVIGTDTLSRITDWSDRNTAVLFADGSGAAIIDAVSGPGHLLGWDFDADGSLEDLLYAEIGGTLHMEGKEVFRRAVRIMVDSAEKSLKASGLTSNEIDLVVPHQANLRIIEAACKRLDIPMSKTAIILQDTGNTSSATIPLALFDAADHGRIKSGDNVLLVGFGAGMTAASAVIKWNQS